MYKSLACLSSVAVRKYYYYFFFFPHFIPKLKLNEHLQPDIKGRCLINMKLWPFSLVLSHLSLRDIHEKRLPRYCQVGYKQEFGFRIYQIELISRKTFSDPGTSHDLSVNICGAT